MKRLAATVLLMGGVTLAFALPAEARRRGADTGGGGVPTLDVKGSCSDAQKFSSGVDKNMAFKGCMQDELNAKTELGKRWSEFKPKDRSNCVEQARFPSPSYVEVLTCLEMVSDAMRAPAAAGGRPSPQIGGPVAPGLPGPTPGTPQ